MNKNIFTLGFALMTTLVVLTSCEEEEDYTSSPPLFSDVTFNDSIVYAGDTLIATAIQSRQARLVDRTTYSWTLSQGGETVDVEHHYTPIVVYTQSPQNPTDTLVIENPGNYVLTLEASYNISGQSDGSIFSTSIPDGNVSCSASIFRFMMTVTKRFIVKAKP